MRPDLFVAQLKKDLTTDSARLLKILDDCEDWDHAKDTKLAALIELLTKKHPKEKVLVFSQFADTVRYLERRLKGAGVNAMAAVSGDTSDPTSFAWRFSPGSNNKRDKIKIAEELRVLIATDVLSEGQNLQDGAILVNYDLP
ncbi:helicase-related protein [Rhizobium sullae]|uniref:helicase-related protein n=1 Tax=Rhizobium sullae TaxID=50338 RepID=UPI0009FC8EFB